MVRPKDMDEILREIGWTDGFNIPAISDENKLLENEVSKLLQEKAALLASANELDELLASVSSHTKELKAECAQNENVLAEQQTQLESESSLIKLLQGEEARLKNAIQLERQSRNLIEERCSRIDTQIRAHENITKETERDTESEQIILGELKVLEAKESYASKTLADYYKQDEAKLKDLELKRIRLQTDVATRYNELQDISTTVNALEQQLDSAARQYRNGLTERKELILRWETSAANIKARDDSTRYLQQEIFELKQAIRMKEEELNENREFEEDQIRNNQELELRTRNVANIVARLKDAVKGQRTLRDALLEETVTMQCQLAGCKSELNSEKRNISELELLMKERENRREQLKQACKDREKRLILLSDLQGGAGERAVKLHTIQQDKERELIELKKRSEKLDIEIVRTRQELFKLKDVEKNSESTIGAQQAGLRQIATRKQQLEQELERHRDMLLCLELSVQRQQLRITRLTSDKPVETEDPKLLDKEKKLQTMINDRQATYDLLKKEMINVEKTERRMNTENTTLTNQLQELNSLEKSLQSEIEGGKTHEDEISSKENELRARLALLQARIAKRKQEIMDERNNVLQLRTSALQVEHASKLQSTELEVEITALKADIAGIEHENSQLKSAIAQRKLKLQQLQNIYDITITSMESNAGDNNGLTIRSGDFEESVTEFITRQRIIVAQEKGELVQKGNNLDLSIKRAEKEIRAMEHTLALVKAANDRYRCNLSLPGSSTIAENNDPTLQSQIEFEQNRQLELKSELKRIHDTEEHMQQTINRLRAELSNANDEHRSLTVSYAEREHEIAEIQRELAEQQVKLRRAINQSRRLSRDIRGVNPSQPTFEERDLEVKGIRRIINNALRELWTLGQEHVEARPLITRYLQEKNLPTSPPLEQKKQNLLSRRNSSRQSLMMDTATAPLLSPALYNVNFPTDNVSTNENVQATEEEVSQTE